jgi:hypothetical protein
MLLALNEIDTLVLPAHSIHLLQMFDVAVAVSLKVTFKQEFRRQIQLIVAADQIKFKKL